MFSVAFQLAGSIMLSWMVLSKSKRDIIGSCWIIVNDKTMMKKLAIRQFKEKYLSLFGFVYITVGYFVQILTIDESINIWMLKYNPLNKIVVLDIMPTTIINIIFLFIIGILSADYLTKCSCGKINPEDFIKNIPTKSMHIESNEHGIDFKF